MTESFISEKPDCTRYEALGNNTDIRRQVRCFHGEFLANTGDVDRKPTKDSSFVISDGPLNDLERLK